METTTKNQVVLTEAQIAFYLDGIANGLIDEGSLKADIKKQLGLIVVKDNVEFKALQTALKTDDVETMKSNIINTYCNAGLNSLRANYGDDIVAIMENAGWSYSFTLKIGSKTKRSESFQGAFVIEKDGSRTDYKTWSAIWEYYLDADIKDGHIPLSNGLVAYQWDFKSCNNNALKSLIEEIAKDGGTLYLQFDNLEDYKCTTNISNSIIKKYVRIDDSVETIEEA